MDRLTAIIEIALALIFISTFFVEEKSPCCGKPVFYWDSKRRYCDEEQGGCGKRI